MSTATIQKNIAAVPHTGAGDAGGVSRPNWYVAIVNNNSEKEVRERLALLGYDTYVATQWQTKIWRNGAAPTSRQSSYAQSYSSAAPNANAAR